jgi:putative endonuclease
MPTTVETGNAAEARAVRLLVRRGYRIVERNFRCGSGELDVVARDGDVLVFVEVRSRADDSHGRAEETVDRRKQRQVAKVAMHYIGLRDPVFVKSRFDVVAITGDEEVLIQDAFRL